MLIEGDAEFHSGSTAHTCSGDGYLTDCLDLTATYPTLQNTGELFCWVQVISSGTADADIYEFSLRASATTDGTDLNGTVVNVVTSPAFTQSGTWCLKTDATNGFWSQQVPSIAMYRYWQMWVEVTNANALDLTVKAGLALWGALPARVGNISQTSGIASP